MFRHLFVNFGLGIISVCYSLWSGGVIVLQWLNIRLWCIYFSCVYIIL